LGPFAESMRARGSRVPLGAPVSAIGDNGSEKAGGASCFACLIVRFSRIGPSRRGSVFRGRRETSGVLGVSPPSRSSRAPQLWAEGGASGDDSHCPRRTQVVVKVTLWVVRFKRGVCPMRRNPGVRPYQLLGDRLACPPGIGPVPSAHSRGWVPAARGGQVSRSVFEPPRRQAGCASG